MNNPTPQQQFAASCAKYGWFIFPLGVKSKVADTTLAPHSHLSASNDATQIEQWWAASPNANIGIDLGRSNLTVLDFDQGEPPAELADDLKGRCTVKTARGLHVYFSGVSKQRRMYFNGKHVGEIKSDGGYVLAPFSVHPDGPIYTPIGSGDLVPVPDGLLDKLAAHQEEPLDVSVNGEKIPLGQHDDTLFKIACHLRGKVGLGEERIYELLVEICENRCENYGTDYKDMCRKKARQACKYPAGTPTELILNQKPNAAVQQVQQPPDTTKWRDYFRRIGEMESGPIVEVIKGVLQEGTCFVGANPGDGKTLVCLAMAKAICTGQPLFDLPQFSVPKPLPVIYLIPESRDRAFRRRCESFRLPDDKSKFLCRTTSAGPMMALTDPMLVQAVRELKPVVFLDTAARFMRTNDENSAAQNQALVNEVLALQQEGAVLVVLVHHATKASANEAMTLENMLRGTSDFAAMCDQVYGIRKDRGLYAHGNGPMEIDLASLKDREQIGQLTLLRLAASRKTDSGCIIPTCSIIDETGNFRVVSDAETIKRTIDSLVSMIERDPSLPVKALAQAAGQSEYSVEAKLHKMGWHRVRGGKGGSSPWHRDDGLPCPYAKPEPPKEAKVKKPGIKDAVAFLSKLLEDTHPEGAYVPEVQVYKEADAAGITDALVAKAKKRLGVVIGPEKGWSLPDEDAQQPEEEPGAPRKPVTTAA